jgi:phenylalanyl-tRNA synthetase beta chain
MFSALEAVNRNISYRNADLRFYELGKVYNKYGEKYVEDVRLSILMTGKFNGESWYETQRDVTFYDLRAVIDRVMYRLGIKELSTRPCDGDSFVEGVDIYYKKTLVARAGRVSKKILKAMDIDQAVYYADVMWDAVVELARRVKVTCEDLPKYPSVRRDLALLVDKDVTFQQLYDVAMATERNILREVNLFDVYEGDKLPAGKKSYALSFVLADDKKTLEDKRIEITMKKLSDAFARQVGAELRG